MEQSRKPDLYLITQDFPYGPIEDSFVKPEYPYFTGMLYYTGGADEGGGGEYELLLTGFDRSGDDMVLLEQTEKVKELFPSDDGRLITAGSSTILVWTDQFLPELPDTDEELSKCQITLKIRRWKGN